LIASEEIDWFATCPKGVEGLLLHELTTLGAASVKETVAGVHFSGTWATVYRVCLWSRLANRVLWPMGTVRANDADALYAGLREIKWATLFEAQKTLTIDFSGTNRAIRNSQFGAQRSKDAIVDTFSEQLGVRPNVERSRADIRVNIRLNRDKAQVGIDLSGGSLHQRGYRSRAGAAPLKENLAAAILLRADWPGMAARGGALIDPMCGSGTLLIEGAMMAANIAPGLGRRRFGFESLKGFESAQWRAIEKDASSKAEAGKASQLPEIRGYDANPHVIKKAIENIAQAGLEKVVRVSSRPLSDFKKPTHKPIDTGLIITNPPYGERMGEKAELAEVYSLLGQRVLQEFPGWQAAIFTSDKELGRATGLRSHKQYTLYNGALATQLLLIDLANNEWREPKGSAVPEDAGEAGLSEGAQMFANRLRKNRKRLSSWVKKSGVECYRLYDADMPEYAVAVDIYADSVHVAEYKAPSSISEEAADRRMEEVRAAIPQALDVPKDKVVFKQRARQRGASQYVKQASKGHFQVIREGRAQLRVNLYDYLDTGLFLDHRPLRLQIAGESADKDFLNLFCYTGSASVHSALGGARSTVSVDSSNTYLEWARKNLELNKLDEARNRLVKADCMKWLQQTDERFDIILLDPPSFSNSKSSRDTFDVQRDHAGLVAATMNTLRSDGVLYFSNNRRGFKMDADVEAQYHCKDITRSTFDPDFARNEKIHSCWRITHKGS
jgi:23S rRNA (guanine2069-N7)-methyltransferase / 23S rRNA (guanine2445-N2)-methyltransferase